MKEIEIAMLLADIFKPLIFGSGRKGETQQDWPNYLSPNRGLLDPVALAGVGERFQALQGAGMPGGRGSPMTSDMIDKILAMLKPSFGNILSGYALGGRPDTNYYGGGR